MGTTVIEDDGGEQVEAVQAGAALAAAESSGAARVEAEHATSEAMVAQAQAADAQAAAAQASEVASAAAVAASSGVTVEQVDERITAYFDGYFRAQTATAPAAPETAEVIVEEAPKEDRAPESVAKRTDKKRKKSFAERWEGQGDD